MTAMNLYLAEARMLEARQTVGWPDGRALRSLLEEVWQVVLGGLVPVYGSRVELGDHLSRDLGLR